MKDDQVLVVERYRPEKPRLGIGHRLEFIAPDLSASHSGMGRDLFATFRKNVSGAEAGGTIFGA